MEKVSKTHSGLKTISLMEQHKKEKRSWCFINSDCGGESGDASPSTPIGVNLPNAD
jgi:dipeptidyl-peptidase-3